jgi:cellulose biosynthesis protein BcsQ
MFELFIISTLTLAAAYRLLTKLNQISIEHELVKVKIRFGSIMVKDLHEDHLSVLSKVFRMEPREDAFNDWVDCDPSKYNFLCQFCYHATNDQPRPNLICLYNFKGGVGKTSISYTLSKEFYGLCGRSSLTLDLDPQCSLTQHVNPDHSFDNDDEKMEMDAKQEHNIVTTLKSYLSNQHKIIYGSEMRTELKRIYNVTEINSKSLFISGDLDADDILNQITSGPQGGQLLSLISEIALDCQVTDVIIDLSPGSSNINNFILGICDYCLCPMMPDLYSLRSVTLFESIINPRAAVMRGKVRLTSKNIKEQLKYRFLLNKVHLRLGQLIKGHQKFYDKIPDPKMIIAADYQGNTTQMIERGLDFFDAPTKTDQDLIKVNLVKKQFGDLITFFDTD